MLGDLLQVAPSGPVYCTALPLPTAVGPATGRRPHLWLPMMTSLHSLSRMEPWPNSTVAFRWAAISSNLECGINEGGNKGDVREDTNESHPARKRGNL